MRHFWDMLFVAIFLFIYDFKWLLRVCRVILYSMQWCSFQNVHFWLHYGLEASPLVMRSRKADLPLATRARKRERCLRGTYQEWFGSKILKVNFFVFFSGNHFSPRFMLPCSLWAESIFSVFRSLHLPLDTQFWTRGFPLVMRSRKADLRLATRARTRELCLYRYVSRMTRTENFLNQNFL